MSTVFDLVGQTFGKLTVVEQGESDPHGKRRWRCRCECGGENLVTTGNLRSGHTTDCGCGKSPSLAGQRFGRLTVVGRSHRRGQRGTRTVPLWECRCDCGEAVFMATDTLKNGDTHMCSDCAAHFSTAAARAAAGYENGTQTSRLRRMEPTAASTTGCRGVTYDPKTGKYRARLTYKGQTMHFGTFAKFSDAVQARKYAEIQYFGKYLQEE